MLRRLLKTPVWTTGQNFGAGHFQGTDGTSKLWDWRKSLESRHTDEVWACGASRFQGQDVERTSNRIGSMLALKMFEEHFSFLSCSVQPHRRQPTRLPHPWDSPGKNTGVGCHFLLQCRKVKSESQVAQPFLTLRNPMDCNLPGSSVHGIF